MPKFKYYLRHYWLFREQSNLLLHVTFRFISSVFLLTQLKINVKFELNTEIIFKKRGLL